MIKYIPYIPKAPRKLASYLRLVRCGRNFGKKMTAALFKEEYASTFESPIVQCRCSILPVKPIGGGSK